MTITAKIIADSKKEADRLGIKRYHARKDCKNHSGYNIRWTSNGACLKCVSEEYKKYRKRNYKKLLQKRKDWDRKNPIKSMLQRSRRRAKELHLPFTLTNKDIIIPNNCPILGVPLVRYSGDYTPSIDRIDNKKGYVPENIIIISYLANRIKNNATIEQLRKVINFYDQYYNKNNM